MRYLCYQQVLENHSLNNHITWWFCCVTKTKDCKQTPLQHLCQNHKASHKSLLCFCSAVLQRKKKLLENIHDEWILLWVVGHQWACERVHWFRAEGKWMFWPPSILRGKLEVGRTSQPRVRPSHKLVTGMLSGTCVNQRSYSNWKHQLPSHPATERKKHVFFLMRSAQACWLVGSSYRKGVLCFCSTMRKPENSQFLSWFCVTPKQVLYVWRFSD